MAAPTVDLSKFLTENKPVELPKTDVSKFKEFDENGAPRVVADAADFIVYSLKSRVALRVLPKKTSSQMVFKAHTTAVKAVRFARYNSNIVASFSETEIFVWGIDGEKSETTPYFKIEAAAQNIAWTHGAKGPELVMLVGGSLMSTPVNDLIEKKQQVVEVNKLRKLFTGVPDTNTMLAAREKSIAVVVDPLTVVVGSVNNFAGSVLQPTNKEAISNITFAGNNLLAIASRTSITVWNVERDAKPVFRLLTNGLPAISGMEATTAQGEQNTVEIFFADNTAAFVNLDAATIAYCKLFSTVRAGGFCSSTSPDSITVLADFGSVLSYSYVYRDTPTLSFDKPKTAVVETPSKRSAAVPAPRSAAATGGAVPQPQQMGTPVNVTQFFQQAAQPAPVMQAPPAFFQPSVQPAIQLRNPALAGPRNLTQAADQATSSLNATRDELNQALQNLHKLMNLQRQMVVQDHNKLTERALLRQAQEVSTRPRNGGAPNAADAGGAYLCLDEDLTFLMTRMTSAITVGVAPAVEEVVDRTLQATLKDAMAKSAKRDLTAEIRQKLDQALANAANEFALRMEDKVRQHTEQQVMSYVRAISAEYTSCIQELQAVVQSQNETLAEYQRTNIYSQLDTLRKDVAKLKASGGATAAAAVPEAQPAPETIVSTAKQFLQSKDTVKGLEWVTRFNNPELTIKLLTTLGDEDLNEYVLSDDSVSVALWTQVVAHLTMTQSADTLEAVMWWIDSILVDHEELTENLQLKAGVAAFVRTWKGVTGVPPSVVKQLNRMGVMVK